MIGRTDVQSSTPPRWRKSPRLVKRVSRSVMGEETYPTSHNGLDWRWLVFLAYVTAWTMALLVPIPENSVGGSVFSLDLKFLLSKSIHVGAYAFTIVLITQLRIGLRWRWLLVLFASLH